MGDRLSLEILQPRVVGLQTCVTSPGSSPALEHGCHGYGDGYSVQPAISVQLCPAAGPVVHVSLSCPEYSHDFCCLCHSCEVPTTMSLPSFAATCLVQPHWAICLRQSHPWALGLGPQSMGRGTPSSRVSHITSPKGLRSPCSL